MDDYVLTQCVFLFQGAGKTDSDDGNRNGGFKHLSHFQSQIGSSGTENNRHQQAYRYGIGSDFRILLARLHDGDVFFPFLQLAKSILREITPVFQLIFLHCKLWLVINN